MKRRNDKEYIKQMQKQIVELKKYIVFLEKMNSQFIYKNEKNDYIIDILYKKIKEVE